MNPLYQRIGGHQGISNLLHHFYADVRQDPVIGPIFNAEIKDWKKHLEIIASFWETLIGGPRTYARPMPMKHLPLHLREEHFQRWLFLWQANCRAQLPAGYRSRNDRLSPPYRRQASPDSRDLQLVGMVPCNHATLLLTANA